MQRGRDPDQAWLPKPGPFLELNRIATDEVARRDRDGTSIADARRPPLELGAGDRHLPAIRDHNRGHEQRTENRAIGAELQVLEMGSPLAKDLKYQIDEAAWRN